MPVRALRRLPVQLLLGLITCGGTKNARQGIETIAGDVVAIDHMEWRNEECPSGH